MDVDTSEACLLANLGHLASSPACRGMPSVCFYEPHDHLEHHEKHHLNLNQFLRTYINLVHNDHNMMIIINCN